MIFMGNWISLTILVMPNFEPIVFATFGADWVATVALKVS